MRKRDSEYHTGRLNISCPPSEKEAIAADAAMHGQSISQFILSLYEKSTQAGSPEHLAHIGLDLMGLKKRLVDIVIDLRRSLARSQGMLNPDVIDDLARLKDLEQKIDATLHATVSAVKTLKEREQRDES